MDKITLPKLNQEELKKILDEDKKRKIPNVSISKNSLEKRRR
jgi:hypothetical protein